MMWKQAKYLTVIKHFSSTNYSRYYCRPCYIAFEQRTVLHELVDFLI